ncbi:MAG: ATP-binding cassette domain-containing protein [Chloroflexota bacterium]
MQVVVRVDGLSKSYGPTHALDEVSVDFRGGSVHTVLGENGSGKSTLIKALSGVVVPDAGSISIDDVPVRRFSPRASLDLGVVTVFQEVLTAPNRSIVENVYLGYHGYWRDRVTQAEQQRRTHELFAELGVPDVDIDAEAERASLMIQQITVIARALLREPRVLILDEGTAALGLVERDALFEIVKRLRADGALIIFVSHRMDEVMEISDRVTVLRSGRVVDTVDRADMTPEHLLDLMAPQGL